MIIFRYFSNSQLVLACLPVAIGVGMYAAFYDDNVDFWEFPVFSVPVSMWALMAALAWFFSVVAYTNHKLERGVTQVFGLNLAKNEMLSPLERGFLMLNIAASLIAAIAILWLFVDVPVGRLPTFGVVQIFRMALTALLAGVFAAVLTSVEWLLTWSRVRPFKG